MNYLQRTLGEENVSEAEIDRLTYSTDASQIKGSAAIVAWPQDFEDIRNVILYASRRNLNIVPRGAGTGLAGAAVPKNSIVIDMSRMNRVMEINKKEKYCTVESGIVLDDLNNRLCPDLFFPVIPSSHAVCTIGGMLSTNAAGTRAVKYGKTEDWILELEVFDGTGKLFKTKNIMDFVGKEGTTGIITKAKLRLTEPLKKTSLSYYKFINLSDLMEKLDNLKNDKGVIGVEIIDRTASEIMEQGNNDLLFVEFENDSGDINDSKQIAEIWKLRDGVYTILASKGYMFIEDPKLELGAMFNFLQWCKKNSIPVFGHIGVGIVHPMFKKGQERLIREMYKKIVELKGEITGEHGYGIVKREFVDEGIRDKIKELKKKYDPTNILNKGKVI